MTRAMTFFDTLLFSETMRESGMNEKTAKALAEELKKINEANYASSKQDVKDEAIKTREEIQNKTLLSESRLEQKISKVENKISGLEHEMQQEFKLVRSEMKTSEQRIISEIKSATLIIVFGLGTIIALVQKFL